MDRPTLEELRTKVEVEKEKLTARDLLETEIEALYDLNLINDVTANRLVDLIEDTYGDAYHYGEDEGYKLGKDEGYKLGFEKGTCTAYELLKLKKGITA